MTRVSQIQMACGSWPPKSLATNQVSDKPPFVPAEWHQLLLQNPVQDVKVEIGYGYGWFGWIALIESMLYGQDLTFSWVIPYQVRVFNRFGWGQTCFFLSKMDFCEDLCINFRFFLFYQT